MANSIKSSGNDIESKMTEYFNANQKFFELNDINGKKAFFCLGLYTRRVLESLEKVVAEKGEQTKEQTRFVSRINREIGNNMTYRSFTTISKILDGMARQVNPKLYFNCSGICKQFIINSDVIDDKKAFSSADANLAFSIGMFQK